MIRTVNSESDDDRAAREAWAKAVAEARTRAGFRTRKALADAMGVSKATIDRHEQGKAMPRQDTLRRFRVHLPDLRMPFEVSAVGADDRDPNGYAVHLPMDPQRRALVLSELLQRALREAGERES